MSRKSSAETVIQYLQDLVSRAYAAMDPDEGSNDAEYEVLYELVEYAEEDIRRMGGELPPRPQYGEF